MFFCFICLAFSFSASNFALTLLNKDPNTRNFFSVPPPLVRESSSIASKGEDGLSIPDKKSAERELLSELLSSDDEDSGFDSLPDSPVFKVGEIRLD